MNLIKFSEDELNRLLLNCKSSDELNTQTAINKSILDIVKVFSDQHFTGTTASYCLEILNRLLNYKPLSPLTGADSEWEDVSQYGSNDTCYQNKRYPAVFKDKDGKAYDVESKIFSDDNGHTWYTSKDSREYIDFPYDVPDKPKLLITANHEERQAIENEIAEIMKSINNIEHLNINENDSIFDYIKPDDVERFIEKVLEKWDICNEDVIRLSDDEYYVWQLVNRIMESKKEN